REIIQTEWIYHPIHRIYGRRQREPVAIRQDGFQEGNSGSDPDPVFAETDGPGSRERSLRGFRAHGRKRRYRRDRLGHGTVLLRLYESPADRGWQAGHVSLLQRRP